MCVCGGGGVAVQHMHTTPGSTWQYRYPAAARYGLDVLSTVVRFVAPLRGEPTPALGRSQPAIDSQASRPEMTSPGLTVKRVIRQSTHRFLRTCSSRPQ
jgi:hypothetical protein